MSATNETPPSPILPGGTTATVIPQTGAPEHETNRGIAVAVLAGIAAVGVGAVLRDRSDIQATKPSA